MQAAAVQPGCAVHIAMGGLPIPLFGKGVDRRADSARQFHMCESGIKLLPVNIQSLDPEFQELAVFLFTYPGCHQNCHVVVFG